MAGELNRTDVVASAREAFAQYLSVELDESSPIWDNGVDSILYVRVLSDLSKQYGVALVDGSRVDTIGELADKILAAEPAETR